ncbi:hypothetical protein [Mesorhizobium sp. M1233]|uniref:hypothetical protein n=1 Tax=Mesorhizobium sp. M1233 TaxID=2957072 RepID=UPI003334E756
MATDPSQERKNRVDVSRPASQRIVEFVEDKDFGLQAVEEMIELLGLATDVRPLPTGARNACRILP